MNSLALVDKLLPEQRLQFIKSAVCFALMPMASKMDALRSLKFIPAESPLINFDASFEDDFSIATIKAHTISIAKRFSFKNPWLDHYAGIEPVVKKFLNQWGVFP